MTDPSPSSHLPFGAPVPPVDAGKLGGDPRAPAEPTKPGGEALPPGEPSGGHLDELTAMRLADGEPVTPTAAGHAAQCAACAALISTFRADSHVLASALGLDEEEASFLSHAQLPAQVAVYVRHAIPFPAVQPDTPASLLAILITAITSYVGWLLVQPGLASALEVFRRSGFVTIAAQRLVALAFELLWAFLSLFQTLESLRLLEAPSLPLVLVALLAWLALSLSPRPTVQPETTTGV